MAEFLWQYHDQLIAQQQLLVEYVYPLGDDKFLKYEVICLTMTQTNLTTSSARASKFAHVSLDLQEVLEQEHFRYAQVLTCMTLRKIDHGRRG